jgi:hypothetical protein
MRSGQWISTVARSMDSDLIAISQVQCIIPVARKQTAQIHFQWRLFWGTRQTDAQRSLSGKITAQNGPFWYRWKGLGRLWNLWWCLEFKRLLRKAASVKTILIANVQWAIFVHFSPVLSLEQIGGVLRAFCVLLLDNREETLWRKPMDFPGSTCPG